MQHRALSVLGLMFLAAACSSAPGTGGNASEPDAGDTTGPIGEPEGPPAKKDAAPVVKGDEPPAATPDAGGAAPSPDAQAEPPATGSDAGTPPVTTGPGSGDYSCTLVIGIAATGQWFNAGFEKLVDGNKWELMAVHSGFIQGWGDPNGAFWKMSPSSACATNAKTPDRVIQVALWLHWEDATVDQWVAELDKVVKNWKAKNPNLKRLEFATFVRSPDMKPCQASMSFKSFIKPEQDMAYEKIAAMYPGLVFVAPKWEVKTCADFGGNPPHFSTAGAQAAAKQIADYYNMK
jgi:hypothetical protein